MAHTFSNAKLLSSLFNGFSVAIYRRGFSAVASQGVVRGGGGRSGMVKQVEEKAMMKEGSETISWVPDPITGYYRPENRVAEIDLAELRESLLNHKIRQH